MITETALVAIALWCGTPVVPPNIIYREEWRVTKQNVDQCRRELLDCYKKYDSGFHLTEIRECYESMPYGGHPKK